MLAYNGFIAFKYYPTSKEHILADIDPDFGVWRYPNISSRQQGACFDVSYISNSYGARDVERIKERQGSTPRVVVLGDSFVEGFGVEVHERLTEVAENASGVEMLNFGVSGDFSSTQQFLLYQKIASTFDPTHIALFLLPDNDFADNDPSSFDPRRYRPYLKQDAGGAFERYYTVQFEQRVVLKPMSSSRRWRRELYNRIYLLNALRQLGDLFESSSLKGVVKDSSLSVEQSSYENYSELDLQRLLWGYRQIIDYKGDLPFHIFVIPRVVDFKQSEQKVDELPLIKDLKEFALQFPDVQIHDLLPVFQEKLANTNLEVEDIFLPCDGHWSKRGHEIAALELAKIISE